VGLDGVEGVAGMVDWVRGLDTSICGAEMTAHLQKFCSDGAREREQEDWE